MHPCFEGPESRRGFAEQSPLVLLFFPLSLSLFQDQDYLQFLISLGSFEVGSKARALRRCSVFHPHAIGSAQRRNIHGGLQSGGADVQIVRGSAPLGLLLCALTSRASRRYHSMANTMFNTPSSWPSVPVEASLH